MLVSAIVLAAGQGTRFASKISKPLIEINHQPVIIYCLKTLSRHPQINDIYVVVNAKNLSPIKEKINKHRINKIKGVVLGGRLRQDSVGNALKEIGSHTDLVLIHDAVRPFIDRKMVSRVIRQAERTGVAAVGVPVKSTIKRLRARGSGLGVEYIVEKTVERDNLWEIQTPQVFRREIIQEAYKKFGNMLVTDDAMLVEKLGRKVSVIEGSNDNIKITTPEDLLIARAIAKYIKNKSRL